MRAKKVDLEIEQGATFIKRLNWYGGGKVCVSIDDVTEGCPTSITSTSHGLATGDTPVEIHGVKGIRKLNAETLATKVDADTFTVPIDSSDKTYTANTGSVSYYAIKDLTDFTARMQIREEVDDTTTIASLTSVAGDITLVVETALITVTIAATATADYDFDEAVYDLELIDGAGVVTRLIEGKVTLIKEVTR